MPARVGTAWLQERLTAAWSGEPEDLALYLAGDDQALLAAMSDRRVAAVLDAGGEVG